MFSSQDDGYRLAVAGALWTRRTVGGYGVRARVWEGERSGRPAVVLVHGLVVSTAYMVPVAECLAGAFRVVAPDLPGFGASEKPSRPLALWELADALGGFIEAIGLERPALLGNSLGCQLAVDLAARRPELVGAIVLNGPTVDPPGRGGRVIARWVAESPRELKMTRILLSDCARAGLRRAVSTYREMVRDSIEEKLPSVQSPALVVRGSRDPIVPQWWAEEVARLLPRGRLVVVPGAGHAMTFHAPLELARVAVPFLEEHVGEVGAGYHRSGVG